MQGQGPARRAASHFCRSGKCPAHGNTAQAFKVCHPVRSAPLTAVVEMASPAVSPMHSGAEQAASEGGNDSLFGKNAFVATWERPSSTGRPASKAVARARSTLQHKGNMESAIRDAAEDAAGSTYHNRDSQRQFLDAATVLTLPPVNVHSFLSAYAAERTSHYEVR